MKYRVIGTRAVGGVDPGGIVDLDPAVVNIPALLGRHIAEMPAPKAAKPAAREGGDE